VHAETGERVLPSDKNAIIEVFKPDQRPGGELIDVPQSLSADNEVPGGGALTTQGLY